jgi:hypothetical protein
MATTTSTASLTGYFVPEADAKAAGSSVGVGASISVAVVDDIVTADVARAIMTTGGYFRPYVAPTTAAVS